MNKSFLTGFIILSLAIINHDIHSQELNAVIVANSTVRSSDQLSMAVVINNNQSIHKSISGTFHLSADNAEFATDSIKIVRGKGSLHTSVIAFDDFNLSIDGFTGSKYIEKNDDIPIIEVNGTITSNTTWSSSQLYFITTDISFSLSAKLIIENGTRIYLGDKVNMFINGNIEVKGTQDNPVLFLPIDQSQPWGGLRLLNTPDSAMFSYCNFNRGGNNENYVFGHSESQPVILIDHSRVLFRNCGIFNNPGKAFGGSVGIIRILDCIVSRCDTGGEFVSCFVTIDNCWYTDMPDADPAIIDDDNDGSYFSGIHPFYPQNSIVRNSCFVHGEDDAIDHNGAMLYIDNCWIEGFYHEGIAASNSNSATIYNSVIKNCEQGIEAGYSSPTVTVDHCVLIENDIGLRFGDSYNWGCYGNIAITNSILFNNQDNIKNYDLLSQGPVVGAIDAGYTMTNDPDYNTYPGCITGIPNFDETYYLQPGSPGEGQANDGSNMGLIDPSPGIISQKHSSKSLLSIWPNPCKNNTTISFHLFDKKNIHIIVKNFAGITAWESKQLRLSAGKHFIPVETNIFSQGIYYVIVTNNSDWVQFGKIIIID